MSHSQNELVAISCAILCRFAAGLARANARCEPASLDLASGIRFPQVSPVGCTRATKRKKKSLRWATDAQQHPEPEQVYKICETISEGPYFGPTSSLPQGRGNLASTYIQESSNLDFLTTSNWPRAVDPEFGRYHLA